ncbi:cathepsin B-like [Aplysia californica]|uniref:Cathepsin B-like n=1 Tax=Aplysia californica TaxID=6500 RepID=A0ABM1VVX7_APLCA|nr:cathepsin B-like [Aplysia californica]
METLLALCTLVTLVLTSSGLPFPPLSDAEIDYVNNVAHTTWRAGRNFQQSQLDMVKHMLGYNWEANDKMHKKFQNRRRVEVRKDLPSQFDPRKKWPNCTSLGEIRDQANCGSCWAFGAVETMSDRICIHGGGNVHISADDMLSCCPYCGMGCEGGYTLMAWMWYVHGGVVTGGQYNSSEGCKTYFLPHCDHHTKGRYKPCGEVTGKPECVKKCREGYGKDYESDKHRGREHYHVWDVREIMQELVDRGPVEASMEVYSDFISYKSGVYQVTKGASKLGSHAIKILGYGVENGTEYWNVANSWNADWGDRGFFKIRRGHNECGIESHVITGLPRI